MVRWIGVGEVVFGDGVCDVGDGFVADGVGVVGDGVVGDGVVELATVSSMAMKFAISSWDITRIFTKRRKPTERPTNKTENRKPKTNAGRCI